MAGRSFLRAVGRRILRGLVISALSAGILVAGMRFISPEPDGVFGGAIAQAGGDLSPIESLYRLLHELANFDQFPFYADIWLDGPSHVPPRVGMPGYSETEMGRGLSDLRSRIVGGPSHPEGQLGLMDAIEYELTRPDWRPAPSIMGEPPPAAPLAAPKRLYVGE